MLEYGAPITPSLKASLYGPPPWHFAGRAISIFFETDPDKIDRLLPPPLRGPRVPPRAGICRTNVHEFICDWGLGDAITWTNPEMALCHEGVIALPAEYEGTYGEYDAFLWCDNDAELAACREVFGWAQKLARVHISWPYHSQLGPGARIRGVVSRHGHRVITADIELKRPADPSEIPSWGSFLCMRSLPSSGQGGRPIQELTTENIQYAHFRDVWAGEGQLLLEGGDDEEISELNPIRIVSAFYFKHEWVKMPAKLVRVFEPAATRSI